MGQLQSHSQGPTDLPSVRLQHIDIQSSLAWLNALNLSISSGEFHTFRLPVPSLWLDILEKIRAAGLNGISVYTHCMNNGIHPHLIC